MLQLALQGADAGHVPTVEALCLALEVVAAEGGTRVLVDVIKNPLSRVGGVRGACTSLIKLAYVKLTNRLNFMSFLQKKKKKKMQPFETDSTKTGSLLNWAYGIRYSFNEHCQRLTVLL